MLLSERNPFVGPRPIQPGERLFGRDDAQRELYMLLQARRIVVLHSPSGAGKSSLVNAGLIPRLNEGLFDVWRSIRVNTEPRGFADVPADTNRFRFSMLLSLEEERSMERRRSAAQLAQMSIKEYVRNRPRRKGKEGRPVVLIFDQFEEVLTLASQDRSQEQFFEELGALLTEEDIWALFVIREDHLAAFAPYRALIPTQMSNTFRLDLLDGGGAKEAAEQLALLGGRSFPAVDVLVRDLSMVQVQAADGTLSTEPGPYVEPVQLQVVCRRLWAAIPENDTQIDAKDVAAYANVTTALAIYYAEAIRNVSLLEKSGDPFLLERRIREWIGNRLIGGGLRLQVRREPGTSGGLENRWVDALEAVYLVRREPRAGADWWELAHDRLVPPILRDNAAWEKDHLHSMQVQARLWEQNGRSESQLLRGPALVEARLWASQYHGRLTLKEQEYLQLSEKRQDREDAERARQRTVFLFAVLGTVAMFLLSAWALRGQHRAQDALLLQKAASLAAVDPAGAELWLKEVKDRESQLGFESVQAEIASRPVAVLALPEVQWMRWTTSGKLLVSSREVREHQSNTPVGRLWSFEPEPRYLPLSADSCLGDRISDTMPVNESEPEPVSLPLDVGIRFPFVQQGALPAFDATSWCLPEGEYAVEEKDLPLHEVMDHRDGTIAMVIAVRQQGGLNLAPTWLYPSPVDLPLGEEMVSFAVSPDGARAALLGENRNLRVWNLERLPVEPWDVEGYPKETYRDPHNGRLAILTTRGSVYRFDPGERRGIADALPADLHFTIMKSWRAGVVEVEGSDKRTYYLLGMESGVRDSAPSLPEVSLEVSPPVTDYFRSRWIEPASRLARASPPYERFIEAAVRLSGFYVEKQRVTAVRDDWMVVATSDGILMARYRDLPWRPVAELLASPRSVTFFGQGVIVEEAPLLGGSKSAEVFRLAPEGRWPRVSTLNDVEAVTGAQDQLYVLHKNGWIRPVPPVEIAVTGCLLADATKSGLPAPPALEDCFSGLQSPMGGP